MDMCKHRSKLPGDSCGGACWEAEAQKSHPPLFGRNAKRDLATLISGFSDMPLFRRPSFIADHSMADARSHTRVQVSGGTATAAPNGVAGSGGDSGGAQPPLHATAMRTSGMAAGGEYAGLRTWSPRRHDFEFPPHPYQNASPALSLRARSPSLRTSASSPRLQADAGLSLNDVAQRPPSNLAWNEPVQSAPASSADARGLGLSMSGSSSSNGSHKRRAMDMPPMNPNVRSDTPDSMSNVPLSGGPSSSGGSRGRAHSHGMLNIPSGRRSRLSPELGQEESMKRPSSSNLRRMFRSNHGGESEQRRSSTMRSQASLLLPPHDSSGQPQREPRSAPQSASVSAEHQRTERHRQNLINEMAITERSYASDMCVVRNVYLAQARLRAGIRSPTPSSSTLSLPYPSTLDSARSSSMSTDVDELSGPPSHPLSNEFDLRSPKLQPPSSATSLQSPVPVMGAAPLSVTDIHVIFAGVEPCTSLALEMSDLLACVVRNECTVSSVMLEKMSVIEQVFSFYCSRHELSITRLHDVTSRNPAAAAFLRECDELSRQHSTAWDLPSLLIKPVQRVLKYPLFLHSVLECTDTHDPEYAELRHALEQMEGVAGRINESKKRMDMVGQHGFEHPTTPRSGFRRGGGGGPLRRVKTPSHDQTPLTDNEDTFRELVAQLHMSERDISRFLQRCSAWVQNVRRMFMKEIRTVDEWIAVYSCSPVQDRASLERVQRLRELLHWRIFNSACAQLETSMHRSVYEPIHALQNLLERPKMVVMNRQAKEADYRRYLHERARRPNAKIHASAMAFLSMHVQLVDEIPTLLRGIDLVMRRCIYAFTHLQLSFFGITAELLREYSNQYMPSIKTPNTASPIGTGHMPDMFPSPVPGDDSTGFEGTLHLTEAPASLYVGTSQPPTPPVLQAGDGLPPLPTMSPASVPLPYLMQNLSVTPTGVERASSPGTDTTSSLAPSRSPSSLNTRPEPLTLSLPSSPALDIPASLLETGTPDSRSPSSSRPPSRPPVLEIRTYGADMEPAPPIAHATPPLGRVAPPLVPSPSHLPMPGSMPPPAPVTPTILVSTQPDARSSEPFYDARSSIGDVSFQVLEPAPYRRT